jgi:hypothetical protein
MAAGWTGTNFGEGLGGESAAGKLTRLTRNAARQVILIEGFLIVGDEVIK